MLTKGSLVNSDCCMNLAEILLNILCSTEPVEVRVFMF